MSTTITVDNGNTNPHIGIFEGSSLTETASFNDSESLNKLLKSHSEDNNIVKAIISNVGNSKRLNKKLSALGFEIESTFISDIRENDSFLGMPVFYSETLGDDRLCQAYFAWKMNSEGPTIVIDCGTFTTVDYITEEGFLGGYIFPGPQTYLSSFQKGAQLPVIDLQTSSRNERLDCKKVPQNTDSAILGSLSVFHQGVFTFINKKLDPKKVILTGGKASSLLPYFKRSTFEKSSLDHRPSFIHEALFQVLLDYENQ
tara:strand:- start:8260 stop:9030 length:771 start_codon:yes stop_codon:yes gene_type:complete